MQMTCDGNLPRRADLEPFMRGDPVECANRETSIEGAVAVVVKKRLNAEIDILSKESAHDRV